MPGQKNFLDIYWVSAAPGMFPFSHQSEFLGNLTAIRSHFTEHVIHLLINKQSKKQIVQVRYSPVWSGSFLPAHESKIVLSVDQDDLMQSIIAALRGTCYNLIEHRLAMTCGLSSVVPGVSGSNYFQHPRKNLTGCLLADYLLLSGWHLRSNRWSLLRYCIWNGTCDSPTLEGDLPPRFEWTVDCVLLRIFFLLFF